MIVAIVLLEYGVMYQLRNVDAVPGYEWCNVVEVDDLTPILCADRFEYELGGYRYFVEAGMPIHWLEITQQAIGPVPHPTEDPC